MDYSSGLLVTANLISVTIQWKDTISWVASKELQCEHQGDEICDDAYLWKIANRYMLLTEKWSQVGEVTDI